MGLILLLTSLAIPAWLGWAYGWPAGLASLGATLAAYCAGYMAFELRLKQAGYTFQNLPDGRGVKRWRVGVVEKQAEHIEWIKPKNDGEPAIARER